ncbi:MAG: hypothetical protein ABS939_09305 [Psychrobacillus sp.]
MLLTTSCHGRRPWSERHYDSSDSTKIASIVKDAINPGFIDTKSMLEARANELEVKSIDSVWLYLSDQVLINVFSTLKGNAPVTKKDIVEHYKAHRDIFDKLPESAPKPVDTAATDIGSRQDKDSVFETTYAYRTDTVNGKPIKVQIKTEYSYAR